MSGKMSVIGMGYVGVPAAALFADVPGFEVTGIQRRSKRSGWKIEALNKGECPIGGDEPGLPELIKKVVLNKKTFKITDSYDSIREADYVLIDVQTPTDADHKPRYVSLKDVAGKVARNLKKGALVCIESTVAPGTTEYIVAPILEKGSGMKAGEDFSLAFSYERVMVGRLLHNIQMYPRIVGGIDEESTRKGMELYQKICRSDVIPTRALTAEVAKTVENSYRDVNIAFANEVAMVCESLGIDAYEVRELVNTLPNDPSNPLANPYRNMHFPGAGVGGHCLPKDSWLLKYGVDTYGKTRVDMRIIPGSRLLNDSMPAHTVSLLEEAFDGKGIDIRKSKVALLGVAFLQDSDDTRNTPSYPMYSELAGKGARVAVHDPYVEEYEDMPIQTDLDKVLEGADAVIIATLHSQYKKVTLEQLEEKMRTKVIIDGRNRFDKEEISKARGRGFVYLGIGKPHGRDYSGEPNK